MTRIVKACDRMRHIVEATSDFDHHQVHVVALSDRGKKITLIDACFHEHVFVVADTSERSAIEIAPERSKGARIAVDHTNIILIIGKHEGKTRTHTTTTYHDDVAHGLLAPFLHDLFSIRIIQHPLHRASTKKRPRWTLVIISLGTRSCTRSVRPYTIEILHAP